MIKTSWKKSLVIAGVLTALCASAAFAAEQADTKPSMRERVGTILHHDEGDQLSRPSLPYGTRPSLGRPHDPRSAAD